MDNRDKARQFPHEPGPIRLSPLLRAEYEHLFKTCVIRPERAGVVDRIVTEIEQSPDSVRYHRIESASGIPWFFVAAIHEMESGRDFTTHLHNGDPLTTQTTHVPCGRPPRPPPPGGYSWEESATDALSLRGLGPETAWSLPGVLFQLERYNGWGYRISHPEVLSPYLWSFSEHYSSGKYAADGIWSPTVVSRQCGAAVILRRMFELGLIAFPDAPAPPALYSGIPNTFP